MTAAILPADIPVYQDPSAGKFVPATAFEPEGIEAWDPWTWADVPLMVNHSMPAAGPDNNGEPADVGAAGSIVAEWGGLQNPVLDYQDERPSVAISPRRNPNINGPAGQYSGAAISAAEASSVTPTTDYWSVLLGQG